MKLVIQAHALRNEPLSQAITGHFDERGGTIGRSDTNTLTLPDPERHVSRLQAEVLFAGRGFSIRNVGSANPIELNGRTLPPGEGAQLAAGDQLVIGGYAMRVTAGDAGATISSPGVNSRTVIRGSAGEARTDPPPLAAKVGRAGALPRDNSYAVPTAGADPFADLLGDPGPASASDPFGDLLSVPTKPRAAPALSPGRAAPGAAAPAAPRAAAPVAPARLPDDFDPFADISPPASSSPASDLAGFMASPSAPVASPSLPASSANSGLDDLLGLSGAEPIQGAPGSSIDAMFGLGSAQSGKSSAELLNEFLAPQRDTGVAGAGDVLDLFGDAAPRATAPTQPAAFNHTPELNAAYVPPTVKSPPLPTKSPGSAPVRPALAPRPTAPQVGSDLLRHPAPGPVARPPASAAPSNSAQRSAESPTPEDLWQAFCQGAGISLSLPQGLNPEMMRLMGQLMHHAVEGTLKLMSVRAAAKQELRAQVTTIQSKNNNPLKFSVDPQAALAQLLQPPMRGFMPGPDALRDAMDDLLGHNIGTMAGTRAALQGVLKRFEPAKLEAKLSNKGVIDAVLPMNRRAKLWELYVEHFQQVQGEATEDFHELFGKAFVKAYEHQLDLLEAARGKAR